MRISEYVAAFNVAATRQNAGKLTDRPGIKLELPAGTFWADVIVAFGMDKDDNLSQDVCPVAVALGIEGSAEMARENSAAYMILMLVLRNPYTGCPLENDGSTA